MAGFGCYGGCGPCGGFNNNGFNNNWNGGNSNCYGRDGFANRNSGVAQKRREVYYEKDDCFSCNNNECCADNVANNCNNWNGGCNNGYNSGCGGCGIGGIGGCGPIGGCGIGSCGPVGGCGISNCGPVGGCGPIGGCGPVGGCGTVGGFSGPRGRGFRSYGTPTSKLYKNLGFNSARRR